MKRRNILAGLVALFTGPAQSRVPVFAARPQQDFERAFSALIDCFVPADDFPGALDLKLDLIILTQVNADRGYRANMVQALQLLHTLSMRKYGEPFELLELAERTRMVSRVIGGRQHQNARYQFRSLHQKTLRYFYVSESAFKMLEYHPPSQGGYPDYARPLT